MLRDRNEDSFLVFPRFRIAAVADGMGGHLSGDVASSVAILAVQRFYETIVGKACTWPLPYDGDLTNEENCIAVGLRWANYQVFNEARKVATNAAMGTTVVAAMFTPNAEQVIVGHVGDSRCYRIRDGEISSLTTDHSLVSEVTEIAPWLSPEEIEQLPGNVVTRALGMGPDVVVDLLTVDTKVGDTYLLCTDGLNGMLSDEEIFQVTTKSSSPGERCEELIERANLAGGTDNTTVVLITVGEDGAEMNSEDVAEVQTGGAVSTLQLDFDDEEDTERHENPYESDEDGHAGGGA